MKPARFDPPLTVILAAAVLFSISLWLRLIGTAWDGWASLHPDERHMVFVALDILSGLSESDARFTTISSLWFDPDSPLNPRGTGRLYVYGEWPLLVVTLYCKLMGIADWGGVLQAGRLITALVDGSTVLAVFLLALMSFRAESLTQRHKGALLAAALYALAPTSMQLANFFTVDAWLATLSIWALVPMVALAQARRTRSSAVLAGVLSGLALACKLTGLALALPGFLALIMLTRSQGLRAGGFALVLALAAAFTAFRLANPFAFSGPGFFGLMPSPMMLEDFAEVRRFIDSPDMPSNLQWLAGYPIWALLRDLALFGFGPAMVGGLIFTLSARVWHSLIPRPAFVLGIAMFASAAIALMPGPLVLRYFAPMLGPAAVLGGIGLAFFPRLSVAIALLAAFWAAGSVRLHSGAHPRLIATEWLRRLPEGTRIAFETDWDEGLPVLRFAPPGSDVIHPPGPFEFVPLRLTDPEDHATAARLADALEQSQYLSISSGRQIEVLPRLPLKFPVATRYYAALISGKLCFERVFLADRGFPLPFVPFDDRFAQEPWRVYDHPVVSIWKKQSCFGKARATAILTGSD